MNPTPNSKQANVTDTGEQRHAHLETYFKILPERECVHARVGSLFIEADSMELFAADGSYSTDEDEDRPVEEGRADSPVVEEGSAAAIGASLDGWVKPEESVAVEESDAAAADAAADGPRYAKVGGAQVSTNTMGSSEAGTLHLIGLGLGDETDITLKGLAIIKRCARVFLESYTSILGVDHAKLEALYGRSVTLAGRDMTESESGSDSILEAAREPGVEVALLVVGDPYGATTHTDMYLRAREAGIAVNVVHNASIMNAIGCCGLQLYKFGQTVSICFFTETWRPDSFYAKIEANQVAGMHTLCLLDIKTHERDYATLAKTGVESFLPPRFMSVGMALDQLAEIEERHGRGVCPPTRMCVGVERVGQGTQRIVAGTCAELRALEWGAPLHSLVLVGECDEFESRMLAQFPAQ